MITLTEIAVVAGGLLLGYWIVAVFLPLLGRNGDRSDDSGPGCPDEDVAASGNEDGDGDGGRDAPVETKPPDGPPVRREM